MKYLFVGLGNPGKEYAATRHNVGYRICDEISSQLGFSFSTSRHGEVAEGTYRAKRIRLLKPTTFMNLSGKAVSYHMKDWGCLLAGLLVFVDDIALPVGLLRMRAKGSAGGHQGLHNINTYLGQEKYARLRLGIGHSYSRGQQADYVLSAFDAEEEGIIKASVVRAKEMALSFCYRGLEQTIHHFSTS